MGFFVEFLWALVAAFVVEALKRLKEMIDGHVLAILKKIMLSWKTWVLAASIFLFLVLSDLTPVRIGETLRVLVLGLPKQEQMVHDALKEFDAGHFQNAVDRSRAVIDEYGPAATVEENDLATENKPWKPGLVPVGKAWSSMEVFSHGSVNSVALAWWITGQSQERLGHSCDAKRAYETAATEYKFARTWDPQWWPIRGWSPFGWFWSPPDDANARAKRLTCPGDPN